MTRILRPSLTMLASIICCAMFNQSAQAECGDYVFSISPDHVLNLIYPKPKPCHGPECRNQPSRGVPLSVSTKVRISTREQSGAIPAKSHLTDSNTQCSQLLLELGSHLAGYREEVLDPPK